MSSDATLPAGTLVLDGRFRVERLLGGGGMGLVYVAEQVSLGRRVALKVLRDDVGAVQGMSERFRREALLLSSVDHPGVVRVIDFGVHDGAACLVLELVEGETLEDVLREGPLPLDRAVKLLGQLAQGLQAIHGKGIVHRDLKPANVLVSRGPDGETARLLDFGIARLAGNDSPQNNVTQTGFVLGTPEYLSPEQGLGQPPEVRSDLYSFGVLAYRVLAGRLPHDGPTPSEFISQHVAVPPKPLLDFVPLAPPEVAALVHQCLEKAASARPASAQEVVERLGALFTPAPIALQPTQLRPTPLKLEAPKPSRKKWLAVPVALAVLAAVGAWLWFAPERVARRWLTEGRGSEVLQVLDDAKDGVTVTTASQLKAAALHQVNRHEEELEAFVAVVPVADALETEAVRGLTDDFGRKESPQVRKALLAWPRNVVLEPLQEIASGPPDKAQWGALRLVDLEWAGQGLKLVPLYAHALESTECRIRSIAAKRLGELHSADAVAPLKRLKELPRKKGFMSDDECGQDAAAQALRRLEKDLAL